MNSPGNKKSADLVATVKAAVALGRERAALSLLVYLKGISGGQGKVATKRESISRALSMGGTDTFDKAMRVLEGRGYARKTSQPGEAFACLVTLYPRKDWSERFQKSGSLLPVAKTGMLLGGRNRKSQGRSAVEKEGVEGATA